MSTLKEKKAELEAELYTIDRALAERLPERDIVVGDVPFTMLKVPKTTYTMGSPPYEANRFTDEVQREASVKSFYGMETPVLQELWEEVMGNNPSHFKGPTRPVESVNYHDCEEFAAKLSERTGIKFRLPTEEEWECMARAGTTTAYWWGPAPDPAKATYNTTETTPIDPEDYSQANPWGFKSILGNTWEWTCSAYRGRK